MAITRWWQLLLGAAAGATAAVYLLAPAFVIALVLGGLLAWASLKSDGDDAMTAVSAGFITGVLGFGLIQVASSVFYTPIG